MKKNMMKKLDLHTIIQKLTRNRGLMKHNQIISYAVLLLMFFTFHLFSEAKHEAEVSAIHKHDMQIKDSLGTYIEEMAAALDLFTQGHPLVFTAYNAVVEQCDDTPNITASNKEIFPGVLALSRELITRYGHGGNINYGDKVWMVVPMQVEDTMNKRWRDRADVYMLDYDQARQFGRRAGILYHEDSQVEFASMIDNSVSEVTTLN